MNTHFRISEYELFTCLYIYWDGGLKRGEGKDSKTTSDNETVFHKLLVS